MTRRQGEEGYQIMKTTSSEKLEEAYRQMLIRHETELRVAIENDTTGLGFIKDMFFTELANHDFAWTEDTEDAIAALGLTEEDFKANKNLEIGLEAAIEMF